MKKIFQKYLFLVFLLPVVVLVFFNIAEVANLDIVEGDTASLVVMATAPVFGLGVPYLDLWEMKPPGIFLLVGLLVKIFGFSMILLKIIQILLLLGTAVFVYLILKKIFTSLFILMVGWFALIVVCSSYLYDIFLPSELFGLFFSLAGLTILLYQGDLKKKFFLGSFFLILAGQMKDPYGFTILAVLPPFILLLAQKNLKKFLMASVAGLAGIMVVVFLILGYLQVLGAFNAYLGVLNYKAEVFQVWDIDRLLSNFQFATQKFQDTVIYFQYYNTVPFIIWFLVTVFIYLKSRLLTLIPNKEALTLSLKLAISPRVVDTLTVLFYSLGSFLGFAAAGQIGGHYAIQAILPLFFIQGTFFNAIFIQARYLFGSKTGKILVSAGVLALAFLFLVSKPTYLKPYFIGLTAGRYQPIAVAKQIYASDRKIGDWLSQNDKSRLNKNSCILRVYGWGVGTTYFYSQLKPCTRFFLANIVKLDWQKKEYRQSLLTNPPAAIIYSREGADMDAGYFEKQVIDISQILQNCYTTPEEPYGAYFPKFSDRGELKNCLERFK